MENKLLHRIKRRDQIAGRIITAGGLLVIASVIGILVLIAKVAMPLFYPPSAEVIASFPLPEELAGHKVISAGVDDYLEGGYLLDDAGFLTFVNIRSGKITERAQLHATASNGKRVVSLDRIGKHHYGVSWDNGTITDVRITFTPGFGPDGKRSINHELVTDASERPAGVVGNSSRTMLRHDPEKGVTRVDISDNDAIMVTQTEINKDLFGNEIKKSSTVRLDDMVSGRITATALDHKGTTLYAGTDQGGLIRWDLGSPGKPVLTDNIRGFQDGRTVTALGFAIGDISLVVGDNRGGVTTWFPASEKGLNEKKLKLIHQLSQHRGDIKQVIPSLRDKSVLTLDDRGVVHIDHLTTERHLLTLTTERSLLVAGLSAKSDGVIAVDSGNRVSVWKLHVPHPEISFATLFGKIWYEGYNEPAYVWQSSAANDDFEPKLSLVPLIFGTLKGTFFAMIFAVPVAILAAIYTSQFLNQKIKAYVKPAVEIMAAIPSVVIGFLGGLWLAPFLDGSLVGFFLSVFLIPLSVFVAILLWQRIKPPSLIYRAAHGHEFLLIVPAIILGGAISYYLGEMIETTLFGSDFKLWLFSNLGIRADQRNSVVISLALGFAVIPIIFTIAEDALSNVPKNLSAASLAVGASRWQTAWKVVLPSAIPGIFSAVMIGFGRAVGETMIVLMATGNTPILSWSMFNGFRTLSANIAVEIPEAPFVGTLYRVLFLSAVMLFVFTFAINTLAEILRQRFRNKYGRF